MTIQTISSKGPAKSQRGYSLIELSIALAILSVIIVGSLMGVQRILANNRTNNVLQMVPRVNAALIAGTLGGGGAVSISTNLAAQLGAFEANAVNGLGKDMTVRNEYGGQYRVTSNNATVGTVPASGGYFVHITNVPKSVCPVLANGLAALSEGMWIGAETALATPGADVKGLDTPKTGEVEEPGKALTIASVGSQCTANNLSTLVAFIPLT